MKKLIYWKKIKKEYYLIYNYKSIKLKKDLDVKTLFNLGDEDNMYCMNNFLYFPYNPLSKGDNTTINYTHFIMDTRRLSEENKFVLNMLKKKYLKNHNGICYTSSKKYNKKITECFLDDYATKYDLKEFILLQKLIYDYEVLRNLIERGKNYGSK